MNASDEAAPARSQASVSGPAQAPLPDAVGGTEPGVLTDVVFDGYVGHSGRGIAGMIAFVLAVIIIVLLLLIGLPATMPGGRPARIAVCSALALAMVLLRARWWQKRVRMLAHEAVAAAEHDSVSSAMHDMLDSTRGMAVGAGLDPALSLLARRGHAGTTLRICRTNEMVVLEALTYPFEPQPLNEMHSALIRQQFDEGGRAPGQAGSAARSFARNVALKGGWALLVIVGFEWVVALIKAIAQRTITWHLLVFSVALLLIGLVPTNLGITHQWFVVPGAIVLRKSGWLQGRWKLHLFERCRSVLCVSHWTRNLWCADVVDAATSSSRNLTRDEAEFLLRAWLSPLPPPPIERLTDLQ